MVERYHQDFVRAGAALGEAERGRLRGLNTRLTTLTTEFGNRVLAEANRLAVHVSDRSELDGLAENAVESAAQAAADAGRDGYLLTLACPPSSRRSPRSRNRDVRRRLHEAATTRGLSGGDGDTRELVGEIDALRAERAALLGFDDHAAYVVDDQTAGTTKAVLEMLDEMAHARDAQPRGRARPASSSCCATTA